MDKTRKTDRNRIVLVIAIVSGVLFCGAIAVGGLLLIGAIAFSDTTEDDVSPAVIENVARIRLPPSARDLRSRLSRPEWWTPDKPSRSCHASGPG